MPENWADLLTFDTGTYGFADINFQ
jgi:hypothetical protein